MINFASKTSCKIVESLLRGQVNLLADEFEWADRLKKNLQNIFAPKIQRYMFGDSKIFILSHHALFQDKEKWLMTDIRNMKKA